MLPRRYRDGFGWFVKIGEDEDGLLVVSHHAPEPGPLTTAAGTVVYARDPVFPEPPEE